MSHLVAEYLTPEGKRAMLFEPGLILLRVRRDDGQTMAEYAVVLGIITLAIVTTLAALSGSVGAAVSDVTGRI